MTYEQKFLEDMAHQNFSKYLLHYDGPTIRVSRLLPGAAFKYWNPGISGIRCAHFLNDGAAVNFCDREVHVFVKLI